MFNCKDDMTAIPDAGSRWTKRLLCAVRHATLQVVTVAVACTAAVMGTPATSLSAQEIRGTVVQSDSTPASGVVVLLMHASMDSVLNRVVTGERGMFTVKAPSPGSVRLRLLRLGFQPTLDGPHQLRAGEVKDVRVVLGEKRVVLATMDVKSDSKCNVRPDSAQLVTKLFEEARKALMAATTPTSSAHHVAAFTLYTRTQDERGKLMAPIQRNTFSGPSYKPFASLPADSLAKVGYVAEEKDEVYYRAPDADVLLSDSFLGAHCLQFVQGTGERAASVGIGFKPADRKLMMVDIRGTLWLDRETNELQTLEFTYDGVPDTYQKMGVGGNVEYTQLAGGVWFVNKWAIRMPWNTARTNATWRGARGSPSTVIDLSGLVVTGGEVGSVKADGEFLYSSPAAVMAGREPRDLRDYSSTGGEFVTAGGSVTVASKEVASFTAIDSVMSMSSCTDATGAEYPGRVSGRVRSLNGQKTDSIPVIAEWKDDFKVVGSRDLTWQHRRLETRTNSEGAYIICGLPVNRLVSVAALSGERKSRVGSVKVNSSNARVTMDLTIGDLVGTVVSSSDKNGRGTLMIVTDTEGNPLPYSTVSVSGGVAKVTDDQGLLILTMAPRDSIPVIVRRIGYKSFQGKAGRDSVGAPYQVMLVNTAQKLATLTVTAAASTHPLQRNGFYERMRDVQRGAVSGFFFTPEELDAFPATHVYQFLQGRTNIIVGNGPIGQNVLLGRPTGVGSTRCAMNIVIDGIVQRGLIDNPDQRTRDGRLDLKEIVNFSQVMAIEVYPSRTNMPASIAGRIPDLNCGAVVIWNGPR
jgi:hypothetical protein